MLLHDGLTRVHSQKEPTLHFSEFYFKFAQQFSHFIICDLLICKYAAHRNSSVNILKYIWFLFSKVNRSALKKMSESSKKKIPHLTRCCLQQPKIQIYSVPFHPNSRNAVNLFPCWAGTRWYFGILNYKQKLPLNNYLLPDWFIILVL